MIIDLPRFIASERPTWSELEELLEKMAREPDFRLGYTGAKRFHYLYQKVSADLARLHTFASEPQLRHYLEVAGRTRLRRNPRDARADAAAAASRAGSCTISPPLFAGARPPSSWRCS